MTEPDAIAPPNKRGHGDDEVRANTMTSTEKDRTSNLIRDVSQIVMSISTLALALVTFFLWLSTDNIKSFSEEQTKIMNEQLAKTQSAVEASLRQAKAAEKGNDNALLIAEQQSRPQITWVEVRIATFAPKDHNTLYRTVLSFKNAGLTGAYDVKHYGDAAVLDVDDNQRFLLPHLYNENTDPFNEINGSFMAPGEIHKNNAPQVSLGEDREHSFEVGSSVFVIWGIKYYRDAFMKYHHFRYCYYTSKSDLNQSNNVIACNIHNDSD